MLSPSWNCWHSNMSGYFAKYITTLERVQSFATRMVTITLGPLSLLHWSSRFSDPRSVNAAPFKNSAYVAEFSVVFPSSPHLFSSIYSPSLLAQELLSSSLFCEDTTSFKHHVVSIITLRHGIGNGHDVRKLGHYDACCFSQARF